MKENNHHQQPADSGTDGPVLEPLLLDPSLLDRLVDDELTAAEYRQVLRLIEDKPDGWRQLALAFLESQAWNKDLAALHPGTDSSPVPPATLTLGNLPGSHSLRSEDAAKSGTSATKKKPVVDSPASESTSPLPNGFRMRFAHALPAIAACFAILFAAGLYLREIQNNGSGRVSSAESLTAGDSAVPPEYIELVSNDSAARVQTPVFSHQKFDPREHANDVNRLTPELRQVVEQSGWQANEKNHLVPIKDPTGNKIIVPLKEIQLAPRKFEDYQ